MRRLQFITRTYLFLASLFGILLLGYGDDEAYNVYDKPWRNADTVGAHIYRPSRAQDKDNYGDLDPLAHSRRFVADKEFAGTSGGAPRAGPVQFERDAHHAPTGRDESSRSNQPDADFDPFGLDRFLSEAKRADKGSRKREHDRRDQHGKKRRD